MFHFITNMGFASATTSCFVGNGPNKISVFYIFTTEGYGRQ